jgi:hypothetical protein
MTTLGLDTITSAFFTSQGSGAGSVPIAKPNLAHLTITPTTSAVVTGRAVTYVIAAFDNLNGSAEVSSTSVFTITNGTRNAVTSACTSFSVGSQTVTGSFQRQDRSSASNCHRGGYHASCDFDDKHPVSRWTGRYVQRNGVSGSS